MQADFTHSSSTVSSPGLRLNNRLTLITQHAGVSDNCLEVQQSHSSRPAATAEREV